MKYEEVKQKLEKDYEALKKAQEEKDTKKKEKLLKHYGLYTKEYSPTDKKSKDYPETEEQSSASNRKYFRYVYEDVSDEELKYLQSIDVNKDSVFYRKPYDVNITSKTFNSMKDFVVFVTWLSVIVNFFIGLVYMFEPGAQGIGLFIWVFGGFGIGIFYMFSKLLLGLVADVKKIKDKIDG